MLNWGHILNMVFGPEFRVDDLAVILKYQNIFVKGYVRIGRSN